MSFILIHENFKTLCYTWSNTFYKKIIMNVLNNFKESHSKWCVRYLNNLQCVCDIWHHHALYERGKKSTIHFSIAPPHLALKIILRGNVFFCYLIATCELVIFLARKNSETKNKISSLKQKELNKKKCVV